ncbi:hypothetical protein CEQ52_14300, partial [Enterobacter kobei]
LKEHAWKVCIRQRIGGSNPPLTAIFKMRARTKVRAFFFYILQRGDENFASSAVMVSGGASLTRPTKNLLLNHPRILFG